MVDVSSVFGEQFPIVGLASTCEKSRTRNPWRGRTRPAERDRLTIAEAGEFDRWHECERLALRMRMPFFRLRGSQRISRAAIESSSLTLSIVVRHTSRNRRMLVRTVQEFQDTFSQVGVAPLKKICRPSRVS